MSEEIGERLEVKGLKAGESSMEAIISIVPRLPPAIDGVGDYALIVADEMRKKFSIETRFIVVDPFWQGPRQIHGFSVSTISQRSKLELCTTLGDAEFVIVNYANYGFDRWGCPVWLTQGLNDWKRKATSSRLVTMFHEIHQNVVGPPWKHAFWLIPYQKKVASNLLRLSDAVMTNNMEYSRKLAHLSYTPIDRPEFLAINSCVGEPPISLPLSQRKKQIVVFGQRRRINTYRKSADLLNQLCKKFSIEKIVDIGPSLKQELPRLDVPINQLGELEAYEISDVLAESAIGMINYSNDALIKSSVFAAYCAHGVLPIVHMAKVSSEEGLRHQLNFLMLEREINFDSLENCQEIADHAYRWYHAHNAAEHASRLYTLSCSTVSKQLVRN
jgi:hypothetical protein